MDPPRRLRSASTLLLAAGYAAAGALWVGFARGVAPAMIAAAYGGRSLSVLNRVFQGRTPHPLGHYLRLWDDFAGAVLLAMVLHFTVVLVAIRRAGPGGHLGSRARVGLALFGAAFLGLAVLSGPRHDYVAYLEEWGAVLRGGDPWWIPEGRGFLLNAYGPLFNPLAPLLRINPLAPKLLFATAYLVFAVRLIGREAGVPSTMPGPWTTLVLNPLPWVEIAYFGHFDVLVGILCVAAVHARERGRDGASGFWLGLGVLLKYLPLALLPFLATGRGRPRFRARLALAASATIGLGLGASVLAWGTSTFRPLGFAATRGSNLLSIFRFLRGRWSPLRIVLEAPDADPAAMPCLLGAGLAVFAWCWWRRVGAASAAVLAVLTTLLFYRVGFVQYQMVLLLLAAYGEYAGEGGDRLLADPLARGAAAAYFGWLALFDVFYAAIGGVVHPGGPWGWVEDAAGLPTFFLGSLLLAALIRATAGSSPSPPPARSGGVPKDGS